MVCRRDRRDTGQRRRRETQTTFGRLTTRCDMPPSSNRRPVTPSDWSTYRLTMTGTLTIAMRAPDRSGCNSTRGCGTYDTRPAPRGRPTRRPYENADKTWLGGCGSAACRSGFRADVPWSFGQDAPSRRARPCRVVLLSFDGTRLTHASSQVFGILVEPEHESPSISATTRPNNNGPSRSAGPVEPSATPQGQPEVCPGEIDRNDPLAGTCVSHCDQRATPATGAPRSR